MERITYKCAKSEAKLPLAQRRIWNVYLGDKHVAVIKATEELTTDRSHSLRIWQARMVHDAFDPFDFPHFDDDSEEERTVPHVKMHEGKPMLANPQPMTMKEARSWVMHVVQRSSQ